MATVATIGFYVKLTPMGWPLPLPRTSDLLTFVFRHSLKLGLLQSQGNCKGDRDFLLLLAQP
ncbi:MAG TPA: hypothetical protein V6D48_03775 [Oculatellaceae cyanobacterium]